MLKVHQFYKPVHMIVLNLIDAVILSYLSSVFFIFNKRSNPLSLANFSNTNAFVKSFVNSSFHVYILEYPMESFDIHISVHKSILTITCCPLLFSIGIVRYIYQSLQ